MTYPYTTSHISLTSQVFSSLLTTWCDPQRSVSPWSAWRPEASAPRWVCRRRQRSAGCGGCARTATWRRAASGAPRGAEAGLCVMSFCMFRLTSLGGSKLASPPKAAFLNCDHGSSMCADRRHSAKTGHSTRHLTPWHTPQTPTAPQRQTTRKTCCSVTHLPNRKCRAP